MIFMPNLVLIFSKSYKSVQNEFGFEHKASKGCFVAKRMFEILNTFIAFGKSYYIILKILFFLILILN